MTSPSDRPSPNAEPRGVPERQPNSPAPRGIVRGHVVVAVNTLRSRLAEPWTLDALAAEVHLSRSQLARAFDATVGTSPMAYLRRMRVERMARLLATTDLSVAEAARAVGWSNQFHASQVFHGAFGVSPTEYRRRQAVPSTPDRGGSDGRGNLPPPFDPNLV
jgi:transcriptional regulator GlxA family with amidase domain